MVSKSSNNSRVQGRLIPQPPLVRFLSTREPSTDSANRESDRAVKGYGLVSTV